MRLKLWQTLLISIVLSLLGLAWLLWRLDDPLEVLAFRHLPLKFLALALAVYGFSFIFSASRLVILLAALKQPLPLHRAMYAHLMGLFGSVLSPGGSGGAPLIAVVLNRYVPSKDAVAAMSYIFIADALFYSWSLPCALLYLLSHHFIALGSSLALLSLVAIVICLALSYILLFHLNWLKPLGNVVFRGILLPFRKKALRLIDDTLENHQIFRQSSLLWHLSLQALTALGWISFLLILYFLSLGFGFNMGLLYTLSNELLIVIVSFIVPTPGASGFFELSTSNMLLSGNKHVEAAQVILLWRFITYYSFFIIGPFMSGRLFLSKNTDKETAEHS